MVNTVIFQVVGYQNSGKTTIVSKLIETLKNQGLRIATIKHHGHGGKPDINEQKDSTKHLSAGAAASIVVGGGRLILQADTDENNLEEQIALMKYFHPDVILIEGYKQKNYPKLLLIRDMNDLFLLKKVTNVVAVMYWQEEIVGEITAEINVPCFPIGDEAAENWIVTMLKTIIDKTNKKI